MGVPFQIVLYSGTTQQFSFVMDVNYSYVELNLMPMEIIYAFSILKIGQTIYTLILDQKRKCFHITY